jgi:hypothetical protein
MAIRFARWRWRAARLRRTVATPRLICTTRKVAGPTGEALIMTALGLAVAIPAVLGYNALVRGNKFVLTKLISFAHELHAYFVTGARVLRDIEAIAAPCGQFASDRQGSACQHLGLQRRSHPAGRTSLIALTHGGVFAVGPTDVYRLCRPP